MKLRIANCELRMGAALMVAALIVALTGPDNSRGQGSGGVSSGPQGNGGNSAYATTAGTATNALGIVSFTTNNYSAAMIQAAQLTNPIILLEPGDYYLHNFTNNGMIMFYGATLHKIDRDGIFILSTNMTTLGMIGGTITGDTFTNWLNNPQYMNTAFQIPPAGYYPFNPVGNTGGGAQWYSNRCGLLINAGGPATYRDLTIKGFEGIGLMFCNPNVVASASPPLAHMSSILCTSNYIGAACAPPVVWYNPAVAEYLSLSGFTFTFNTVALMAGAGNVNITGDVFAENYCSIFFETQGNEAHGMVSDCTINHTPWAIVSQFLPIGELIQNNIFAAVGGFYFDNAVAMEFKNNRIDNDGAVFMQFAMDGGYGLLTNKCNTVANNSYRGTWGSAASGQGFVITNSASLPLPVTLNVFGNYSINGTNADGTQNTDGATNRGVFAGSFSGNGSGLTNIPAAALDWSKSAAITGTDTIVQHIPVFTNAGIIYYINISTNH